MNLSFRVSIPALLVYSLSFGISACSKRPEIPAQAAPSPEKSEDKKSEKKPNSELPPNPAIDTSSTDPALWISTSVYPTGGTLFRLDLGTGKLVKTEINIGADTAIRKDTQDRLFILNRMTQDRVTWIDGKSARVIKELKFTEGLNPQAIVRDPKGRVWVSFYDSNSISIYDSELETKKSEVDLSGMKEPDSKDGYAEIGAMTVAKDGAIWVTAQRLDRKSQGWKPYPTSAAARISSETESAEILEIPNSPNPMKISDRGNGAVDVVFGGDLSGSVAADQPLALGSISHFSRSLDPRGLWQQSAPLGGRILSAQFDERDQKWAILQWFPEKLESCLFYGPEKLLCEKTEAANRGYVFGSVEKVGGILYLTYFGKLKSELWAIAIEEPTKIQKVEFPAPIASVCRGP